MKNRFNFTMASASIFTLLAAAQVNAAANFTISPSTGYPFPTEIGSGQTISVYYTVLNNTRSARTGYKIRGLPASVKQNTKINNSCTTPVSLAAHGSCILRLDITEAVQSTFSLCKGASCTQAAVPIQVINSSSSPTLRQTLTGYSTTTTNSKLAVAYTSINQGASWSLSPVLPVPTDSRIPEYITPLSLACDSNTGLKCTLIGSYINSSNSTTPLSYYSTDGGLSWTLSAAFDLPADATTSSQNKTTLSSISCDSATSTSCVATGRYQNNNGSLLPLSYTSTNSGQTWTLSTPHPLPANASSGSALKASAGAVSCDTQNLHCLTVSSYTTNQSQAAPIAFRSSDGGQNWTISSTAFSLPSDGVSIASGLTPSSCNYSGQICQSVFLYNTNMGIKSLVYVTKNGGDSWSYGVPPAPLSSSSDIELDAGISCDHASGLNCVSTGFYQAADGGYLPLVYTSTDGGLSWIQRHNLPIPADAATGANTNIALVGGITCDIYDAKACTAVGTYTNTSGQSPALIYNTIDSGQTWSLGAAISQPDNTTEVLLTAVK